MAMEKRARFNSRWLPYALILPQMVVTLALESAEGRDAADGAIAGDRRVLLVPRVGTGYTRIGTVARIDPSTNKVVARIRVARNPYGIAARSRSLWVASLGAGTISSLEASSGRVVKTIRVGGDPVGVALTSGGIWFSQNSEGAVTRLSNQNGHASKAS